MVDISKFRSLLDDGLKLEKLSRLSKTEVQYIRDKSEYIIEMIDDMDNRGFLKRIPKEELQKIDYSQSTVLKNFDHIKDLNLTFFEMLKKSSRKGTDKLVIQDDKVGAVEFSAQQIATLWGWTYATLCEIIRDMFITIIDFDKLNSHIKNSDYRIPTGIGSLIKSLKEKKVKGLEFFKDIDPRVRNSFFHFDFEFKDDKVYCNNDPIKYGENSWRTQEDNSQKNYILLGDLQKLVLNADRSFYPLMVMTLYILRNQP